MCLSALLSSTLPCLADQYGQCDHQHHGNRCAYDGYRSKNTGHPWMWVGACTRLAFAGEKKEDADLGTAMLRGAGAGAGAGAGIRALC